MKKTGKKIAGPAHFSVIANATIDESHFLQDLVEQLASDRPDAGFSYQRVQPRWKAIEISSIEAYVSGNISMSEKKNEDNFLFTTSFIFTCTKGIGENYGLSWSASLN